jgi:hypothetical protein
MEAPHVVLIGPAPAAAPSDAPRSCGCGKKFCLRQVHTRAMKRIAPVMIVVGLVAGCGSGPAPTVAVDGKVTFQDGKPLPGGFIFLIPTRRDGWEASGTIQPDGTFRLESLGLDGAVPGDYKVRLALDSPASGRGARKKKTTAAPPIDRKYLDENSSGLTVTVPPGGGPVAVRLD